MQRTEKRRKRAKITYRLLALTLMVLIVIATLSQTVFAQNSYVITDGDNITVHQSYSTDPDEVLDEVGIELNADDTYTTSYTDGVSRIDIQRMQLITVVYRGEETVVGTDGETVAELLARINRLPGEGDDLSCDPNDRTYNGMCIEVAHREIRREEIELVIPFETNYFEDASLESGEEIVLVAGADGLQRVEVEIVYENGLEVSRKILKETVISEPVKALIVRGTQEILLAQPEEPEFLADKNSAMAPRIQDGVITTAGGTTYHYSKKLSVVCTAYSCEGHSGITATGTVARVGAVAVDPRYIPLGTKMYIVSNDGEYVYGYCVAEDTGGLIKGMKIDLYFDTVDECWDFGYRGCTVYVIED